MFDDEEFELLQLHAESPYHHGSCPRPTWRRCERNASCGDWVQLEVEVVSGRIVEGYFDGNGCIVSQAAASILCQYVESKDTRRLIEFQPNEMLELLKIKLTPLRQRCGLLAFRALKAMLYEHATSNG